MKFAYSHKQGVHAGKIVVDPELKDETRQSMTRSEMEGLTDLLKPILEPVPHVGEDGMILIDYVPNDGDGLITVSTTYHQDAWAKLSKPELIEAQEDLEPELSCTIEKG